MRLRVWRLVFAVVPACEEITLGELPGDAAIATWQQSRGNNPSPPAINLSRRAVYAVAFDADCVALAAACALMPKATGNALSETITLARVDPLATTGCAAAETCVDGDCLDDPTAEAGASVKPPDAAVELDEAPPAVVGNTPEDGLTEVSRSAPEISVLFSERMAPGSIQVEVRNEHNELVPGQIAYNDAVFRARFTPDVLRLLGATSYTVTVAAAEDVAGNALTEPATWTFRTERACPCSVWKDNEGPAAVDVSIAEGAVELGMRFRPLRDGRITAVRYYRAAGADTTVRVNLWNRATKNLLGTATAGVGGAAGWRQVPLPTPVDVEEGQEYEVLFFAGNGVFLYNASSAFPTESSWTSTNYWVDVVFEDVSP